MKRIHCINCKRWYITTGEDQCDIPDCGIFEDEVNFLNAIGLKSRKDINGINFIKNHMDEIYQSDQLGIIYGKPSELNINNDCYFYLSPLSKFLFRFLGI